MNWKTIEEPPIDQSNVLIVGKNIYCMGWYQPGNYKWIGFRYNGYEELDVLDITHWRELPKTPKGK